mgnify:CR=1 FL=1
MTHELKILEPFADAITNGEKTFEVRRNDRNFQKGDLVKFEVISAQTGNPTTHKIDAQLFRIGYVLRFEDFPAGLSEGFAVFTITPEPPALQFLEGWAGAELCKLISEDDRFFMQYIPEEEPPDNE